ncbi:MAG: magnesium protoporphyrin IX methyltransferase [Burkholderiales bacterium]|jgi:magnesium-protoporphyrin O-methyltransferase|nr:magnesium protoporphyrin IX methyltransferase [Nitrosomonadaceae bacterium]
MHSTDSTYQQRRGEIETYFDRTAVEAWKRLTSDAPVGSIRATVRAGRTRMRDTLLSWLPPDLSGARLLDAGCGTGALAIEAAKRGASVVAIDLSPTLVDLARERAPRQLGSGSIDFRSGDMLANELGTFDYVVGMDSLIHYNAEDAVTAISRLSMRTRVSILFTFAPRTATLAVMHSLGRFFPRSNRAPSIEPVAERTLYELLDSRPELMAWSPQRTQRIASGFYTSQAMELVRA